MSRHLILLLTGLTMAYGPTVVQGDDIVMKGGEALSPLAHSSSVRPIPASSTVAGSRGLAFFKIVETGGFADAERTSVRIVQSGRIVQAQRVGEGGVAQIADVVPGVYSVIASGPEGIAAYGISWGQADRSTPHRVGLIPARDATLVRTLIRTHLQQGGSSPAEPTPYDDADVSHQDMNFEIDTEGRVKGKALHPTETGPGGIPLANLYIAFIHGGQVVAQTQTDARGNFTLTGLSPGLYSLAVAGAGGFAAYSVEVRRPEAYTRARIHRLQFVALLPEGTGGTVFTAAAGDAGHFLQATGTPGSLTPAETAAGGDGGFGSGSGGGSTGGGGGGLGGGGLLGALAGAGLGAGIGAALAQDKGQGPATPSKP